MKSIVNFDSREVPTFNAKVDTLVEELNRLKYNGYKIVLATNTYDRVEVLLWTPIISLSVITTNFIDLYSKPLVIRAGIITICEDFISISLSLDIVDSKPKSNKSACNVSLSRWR